MVTLLAGGVDREAQEGQCCCVLLSSLRNLALDENRASSNHSARNFFWLLVPGAMVSVREGIFLVQHADWELV